MNEESNDELISNFEVSLNLIIRCMKYFKLSIHNVKQKLSVLK